MKKVLLGSVLTLALGIMGGCEGPDKQFVDSIDRAFRDYRSAADPSIQANPALTEDRKRALLAESAEIQKTIDVAKEDK